MLRPADLSVLVDLGLEYELHDDGGFVAVLVKEFPMPGGLSPKAATLLLRLPLGFPDATPDMFWFDPAIASASGASIPGTEHTEVHAGRPWQRWSRHIQSQWRPGIDNLETYLAYVRRCLDKASGRG